MSTPHDIFTQAAADIILGAAGKAATITYNGTGVVADVSYHHGDLEKDLVGEEAKIVVKVADVAQPAYRDTVVIGATTWRVKEDGWSGDAYIWNIELYRSEGAVM